MKTRTLCLIEDNDLMREMLQEYLSAVPGLRVDAAFATAEAALEALPRLQADLLLIDVALPGMNGIALAEAVRNQRPDLPCLMLSAHQEAVYARRAAAAGARGYILKGAPEEIRAGVQEVLKGGTYMSRQLRRSPGEGLFSP